jgi:predicted phosphodiesterase
MSPFKNASINVVILATAKTFIDNLAPEEKLRAFAMIKSLGELPHPSQLVKLIDKSNRIYEVRGATKDFWIRMFWFQHKIQNQGSSIIITHGYLKKENKTDPNEVKKAKKIKQAYEAL